MVQVSSKNKKTDRTSPTSLFRPARVIALVVVAVFLYPLFISILNSSSSSSSSTAGTIEWRHARDQEDGEEGLLEEEEKAQLQLQPASNNRQNTATSQYYDDSKIVPLAPTLDTAPQTIVTAYFAVKSKYPAENYMKWMKNILSVQDPMVIFLSPSLIPDIQALRQHALNRTVIIPMEVEDVPLSKDTHIYNTSFWQHQLDIDPEAKRHRSYHVFWIWLSKSWWVTEAIRHNFFQSEVFLWSDMGCFRNEKYNGLTVVQHPDQVPRHSMLFLAHHPFNPPPQRIWNNKYTRDGKPHFYHSGSMMAGYYDVWPEYHAHFLQMIREFIQRDMFIGEDQTVAQSTCFTHTPLCAYINMEQLHRKDNHYFGLRYILHHGGQYDLWYHPPLDAT